MTGGVAGSQVTVWRVGDETMGAYIAKWIGHQVSKGLGKAYVSVLPCLIPLY